jgi:hypothetical protein
MWVWILEEIRVYDSVFESVTKWRLERMHVVDAMVHANLFVC